MTTDFDAEEAKVAEEKAKMEQKLKEIEEKRKSLADAKKRKSEKLASAPPPGKSQLQFRFQSQSRFDS